MALHKRNKIKVGYYYISKMSDCLYAYGVNVGNGRHIGTSESETLARLHIESYAQSLGYIVGDVEVVA